MCGAFAPGKALATMRAHIAAAEHLIAGEDETLAGDEAGSANTVSCNLAWIVATADDRTDVVSASKLRLTVRLCSPRQDHREMLHKMASTYHMWVMKAMLMVDAMPGSDEDAKVANLFARAPRFCLSAGCNATAPWLRRTVRDDGTSRK